jgi:predicted ribosomally synthesized peptide with nif11-like leader
MGTKESIERGIAFMEKAQSDPELLKRVKSAETYEQLQEVALSAGFDLGTLTKEEAAALAGGDVGALGELSDADLEKVAGGFSQISTFAPNDFLRFADNRLAGLQSLRTDVVAAGGWHLS